MYFTYATFRTLLLIDITNKLNRF